MQSGTVLIRNANELMDYSKGEEDVVEKLIKSLHDAGINAVVSGGKFGEMHIHFLNKYNIMGVKIQSKFDLRRLCRTVKAAALTKLVKTLKAVPKSEDIGHCDHIYADEVGDTEITVFKQESSSSRVATIVIRGSSDNVMDDIERAIDDGVNAYKTLTKDARLLPGAGAVEVELARRIDSYGEVCPGLDQYAIKKFALALEALPKQLADNSGARSTVVLSKLYAEHQQNKQHMGVDLDSEKDGVINVVQAGIFDLYLSKLGAIRLATNAACTVLKIDQIIMAKQSGGPKPKTKGPDEED
ncbi:unnamed protein product [Soboliphyme baturini]|uniref:T-complex protein 1 subunit theta n=1 Tax=Soboliphyme baturini TaxID=241478 RepID=A0A183I8U4_9BILA|nr:unnamed protein product [Soboliphyme baturini]